MPIIIYSLLAGYVNKTRIILDSNELKIKHGPIPWIGGSTLNRYDIVQLFTKVIRGNKGRRSYRLYAILADGKQRKILSGRPAIGSNLLLFVAQELEATMGIKDKYVKGEFTGEEALPSFREAIDMFKELRPNKNNQTD